METVIVLAIAAVIANWAYNSGKRTGSQKAYHVGRKHGQRRRR
jgi:hypothetical protein